MMVDNPVIRLYEKSDEEHRVIGTDYFGIELYPNDEVIKLDDGTLIAHEQVDSLDFITFLMNYCGGTTVKIKK